MQFWVQDIDRPWVHPFITNWTLTSGTVALATLCLGV